MTLHGAKKDRLQETMPRQNVMACSASPKTASAADSAGTNASMLPTATIFHEPWWLAIASDGGYEEAIVDAGGSVVGRLPYVRLRKVGWQTALIMPTMTHVLGPSLTPCLPGSDRVRSQRRFMICSELIAQLPKAAHIWFAMHRGVTDTLAFEAGGFTTGVRFTTEIMPDDSGVLWREMRDKTRNVIRRAQEGLLVQVIDDPSRFLDFYEENLRRRGQSNNYDRRICANLMEASLQRGVGRILVAADAKNIMQAAIFTAWDHEAEYYMMSTRAPDSGNGATSLLIWTAIRAAAAGGRIFDMDGIDSRTNRLLVTGFGGTLKPRYVVTLSSTKFQVGKYIKTGLERFVIG